MTNDELMTNDEIRTEKRTPLPGPLPFERGEGEGSRLLGFGFRHSDFGFHLLLLSLAVLVLAGCAGYKLGPTNGLVAHERSIQVNPFSNQTLEPRVGEAVTTQLRKQLQRDGTYELASHDNGDIIVTGVITHFHRHELSFAPRDILTVRDYRVSLTAQVTARERSSGKIILDQPVTGYTLIRVGPDLTSSERQALPLLAGDLAKHVTALLVEGSW